MTNYFPTYLMRACLYCLGARERVIRRIVAAAPGIDAAGLSAMGQSLKQLQQRAREVGVEEAATLDMRWAGVVDGGGKPRLPDSAPA